MEVLEVDYLVPASEVNQRYRSGSPARNIARL